MNIDDVIRGYVKLRDEKEDLERKHKEELAPVRERMQKIEAWLQNQLQEQGLTNFKGESGTAFLQEASSATVADWDATLDFIKKNGAWELLERRVSKTVVQDFIESTGDIPPGVSYKRETVVRIRRG